MNATDRGRGRIQGTVAPGFEPVRDALARDLDRLEEENVQLCVYHKGERVVDLWASTTNDATFSPDSLINVFSSGKSLETIAVASLVARGLLDYGAKIADYWPEFRANGKGEITVADLMRHEGGLAAFNVSLPPEDLWASHLKENRVGRVIEEHPARFPTGGSVREYHAVTRGWIVNELFRRVDPQGRTVGEYLREEIQGPLEADAIIGVHEAELGRIARVLPLGIAFQFLQSLKPRALGRKIVHNIFQLLGRLFRIIPSARHATVRGAPPPYEGMRGIGFFNERSVSMGETPSAAAKCSARGLARIAAMMAARGRWGGREVLTADAWQAMHAEPVVADMGFAKTRFTQGGVNQFVDTGGQGNALERGAERRPRWILRMDGARGLDLPVAPRTRDRLRLRPDCASRPRLPERARKGLPGRGHPLRRGVEGVAGRGRRGSRRRWQGVGGERGVVLMFAACGRGTFGAAPGRLSSVRRPLAADPRGSEGARLISRLAGQARAQPSLQSLGPPSRAAPRRAITCA